ncbi:polysaccharide deacetylase family protein [Oceanobacillus kimchii]|uniref:polysaccharide deacetylase family protein n=1 Tax=Oceanobacillus kimchii TaxID=746691 RepID=UPI000346D3F2|nr:polysaccharide deacetylase family protein [Oceanobacillus kimchii]MCT1576230.1 polysaccharide deacetylase family protein [Oceanobacillus kimchii]MCT2135867.1 polysaccharide deacetylase family protein [Oceanobacillus kimchii]
MRRYQKFVNLFVFIILVFTVIDLNYNPFQLNPLEVSMEVPTSSTDELYMEIEQKSKEYKEEPQNAYIDNVWKKTPGRNGRQVDVNASYEKMKDDENRFNDDLFVFDEIPPKVSLDDLPASPIYRGHPEKQMTAFLINVSWGEEYIPEILQVLKKHEVKATFFIEGKWAKENSEIVQMIDEQGHLIGNHAYNHPDMATLSEEEAYNQINQTNQILNAITGETPKWFAPPSGSFSDTVVQTAADLNMETILWTVDTIDWKNPSVSVMVNRIREKIHPGATVLMHPTASSTRGLEEMITIIKEKGYKIGTIEALLSEDR